MKHIYILILILLSSLSFAYDTEHIFNISTVPVCNNYNTINIRSDTNMVTNETIFPVGKCKDLGNNLYNCPCTKDNKIYINATEYGLYNFFVVYYISPFSIENLTKAELEYSRMVTISNIQVDMVEEKSSFLESLDVFRGSSSFISTIYIILAVFGVVILTTIVIIYKFIIVPYNKDK